MLRHKNEIVWNSNNFPDSDEAPYDSFTKPNGGNEDLCFFISANKICDIAQFSFIHTIIARRIHFDLKLYNWEGIWLLTHYSDICLLSCSKLITGISIAINAVGFLKNSYEIGIKFRLNFDCNKFARHKVGRLIMTCKRGSQLTLDQ